MESDRIGVSCDVCHRMVDPIFDVENPVEDEAILDGILDVPTVFGTGMFVLDFNGLRRGPTNPDDLVFGHEVVESPFHREAAFCGTCHNVSNPVFENDGSGNYVLNALDTPATDFSAGHLAPIERTYSEWLHSDYNTEEGVFNPDLGGNKDFVSTCQDCHMRDVGGQTCFFGNDRPDMPQHDLTGGSTWMMGLLADLYPDDIDADAQANAVERGRFLLQNSAELTAVVYGDQLTVTVTNNTGHKLPTGYPDGRRMWINVQHYGDGDVLIGESAAYDSATGELSHDAEAKIYEAELGLDQTLADLIPELSEGPSFHFVLNNKVFKDNRIPPRGFTNANFASFGGAPVDYSYPDFQYWDDTTYTIPLDTARVEIALYYQSTSKEYIEFLRDENTTNSKGQEMFDLWNDNDKSPPELMESVTVFPPDQIWYVDDDGACPGTGTEEDPFCTIQAAIDAAVTGNDILVAEGVYNESINFNGKGITLHSTDPMNPSIVAATVIDATGLGSTVVTCDSGEGSDTVLSGFTITGGTGAPCARIDGCGGGMYIEGSAPTLTYCTFVTNEAFNGGGMYNLNSNPIVTQCSFTGNVASGGGGMYNHGSNPTLTNCNFNGNDGASGGGMLNGFSSSPTLTNCTFSENTSGSFGGAMFNTGDCNPTLINCTFSLNTAAQGGAILNFDSSPTLTNCILWGDSPDEISNFDNDSNPTVSSSDVQGGLSDGTTDGGGNIDADPMFVDADNDNLRLLDGSPCVNTGDTSALPADTADLDGDGDTDEPIPFDLDGLPREVCAGDVDMGAYELQSVTTSIENVSLGTFYCTIQEAIDAASNGHEVVVDQGTYFENINFLGKAITLRSTDPTDPAVIAATIIDGGGNGTVVTCDSAEGPDTILVGLTITGGDATNGGGMLNDGSSPTVANCIFSGNDASSLGGGMGNGSSGSATVINCLFTGNTATFGAGMANFSSSTPSVINCTFSGNDAFEGGGMSHTTNAVATLTNCILWGDTPNEFFISGTTPTVTFSNIQEFFTGEGNISEDPLYADAGSGDYRLLDGSPCIDTGNASALPPDVPDLDSDGNTTEPIPLDLDGLRREVCAGDVDMGAYEFQIPATSSIENVTQGTFHCAIQEAIDAATDGDEVVVEPGTYFENINFNGKAITLRSSDPSDPAVVAATIIDANGDGTVVTCNNGEEADTILNGFTVTGGASTSGAGMDISSSSPTVINCTFSGNAAEFQGGGLRSTGSPTVTSCRFVGNTAVALGGAIADSGSTTITNCTFVGNDGGGFGGAIANLASDSTVTNCTFIGNIADEGGAIINNSATTLTVTNCMFGGNTATIGGGGMLNQTGSIVAVTNSTFTGNVTAAGGGMLNESGSNVTVTNCILWGDTPDEISGDGAPTVTFTDVQGGFVGEGNIDADPLFVDANGDDDTPGNEDDNLRLLDDSPCVNTGDTSALPADTADLDGDGDTAEPIPLDLDGLPRAVCPGDVDMGAYEFQSPPMPVENLTQGTFHCTIQEAIDAATNGDEVVVDQGTYFENINFNGKAITLRSTDPSDPAVVAATIIDADGDGTVVTCESGEGLDTVLNGFTIANGNGLPPFGNAGGMLNTGSSPTVSNCTFSNNQADNVGGGMYNTDSSAPTVSNCTFSGNTAGTGGGMYNGLFSDPTVTNCVFIDNTAGGGGGGGMFNSASGPAVTSCTFISNMSEEDGGGMRNVNNASPTVTNCIFVGNTAQSDGGAMSNRVEEGTQTLINCAFFGNSAEGVGGALHNQFALNLTVVNCLISGNSAGAGGGMYNVDGARPTVTNSILWDDVPDEIGNADPGADNPTVSFSNVQGGLPAGTIDGGGNIDADPLFVDPDNDDLRFLPGSPCIDAASNDAVPADAADLDGDGDTDEPTPFDLDGNPRFLDDPTAPDCPQDPGACGTAPIIDMGPYESQITKVPCEGDANGDGVVDPLDSGFVLARFGCPVGTGDPGCDSADQNGDGVVDPLDSGFVLARFGPCP